MAFVNTFLVGTDLSLSIFNNQTGASVVLDGKRTSFKSKAKDKVLEGSFIDSGGVVDHRVIPGGWNGTLAVDRQSDDFATVFALLEANYYAGNGQVTFTITATEPNLRTGGTGRYQYVNVVFHGYDPGEWTKDSQVKATVDFDAAQRIKVQ
jgi:hypothetical protein